MTSRNCKSKEPLRPLTPNEKLLLGVLALVVFVGGSVIGYRALAQKSTAQDAQFAELRASQAEAKVMLLQQPIWSQRQAWIDLHEPIAKDDGDAKAQTLQFVLGGARSHGLQVMEQGLDDTVVEGDDVRVQISLTVKGPMQALAEWLAGLQDPASFYAVPDFSLKADSDQKAMLCTLHVARYFKKGKA